LHVLCNHQYSWGKAVATNQIQPTQLNTQLLHQAQRDTRPNCVFAVLCKITNTMPAFIYFILFQTCERLNIWNKINVGRTTYFISHIFHVLMCGFTYKQTRSQSQAGRKWLHLDARMHRRTYSRMDEGRKSWKHNAAVAHRMISGQRRHKKEQLGITG